MGSSTSEKILLDQFGHSQKFIGELKQLQKFLLSVTAKDVSLLITFRKVQDANLENELHLPKLTLRTDQMMRVMISVIDLYPKAVHRIPTWIEKSFYKKRSHYLSPPNYRKSGNTQNFQLVRR